MADHKKGTQGSKHVAPARDAAARPTSREDTAARLEKALRSKK